MNVVLNIFGRTFAQIPTIQPINQNLKQALSQTHEFQAKNQIAHLFHISQLILKQTAELQHNSILQLFDRITREYSHIDYDYANHQFKLSRDLVNNVNVQYYLKSIEVQKYDHPSVRKSLYFHELKDMDKYIQNQKLQGMPKFWDHYNRKRIQGQQLNKENPLGIPKWAKPLELSIIVKKQNKQCFFKIESKYGKLYINEVGNLIDRKTGSKYTKKGMILTQKKQELMFDYLQKVCGLYEEDYLPLNKLAFVGGAVKKLQIMHKAYKLISAGHISQ